MPFIKLTPTGYKSCNDMFKLITYILSEENRSINGLVGGNMILSGSPQYIYEQMLDVKKKYNKQYGRFMRHLIISPSDYELQFISLHQLYLLGQQICNLFPSYQTVFAIHQNTNHPHIHIAINTVSFIDGKKLQVNLHEVRKAINRLFAFYVPHADLLPVGRQEYQIMTFDELGLFDT